ncbi:MAG: hypothetical protein M0Q22_00595 [Sulfuritalea sp.]|jgi:hypothetical protein|nr:hypothetical protein [Sulfuritalea sp.]
MTGSFDYSVQNSAQYNVRFWPIVLTGVRAALLPLKKPWFSVAVGLLAQMLTHPIGHKLPLTNFPQSRRSSPVRMSVD